MIALKDRCGFIAPIQGNGRGLSWTAPGYRIRDPPDDSEREEAMYRWCSDQAIVCVSTGKIANFRMSEGTTEFRALRPAG